jgi:hypothetical protein
MRSRTSLASFGQVALDAGEFDEALIDGIDLLPRPQTGGNAHHPVADVAIQGEVGTQGHHAIFLGLGFQLEPGMAHADAQGLGFIAAGNDTAVVVSE